MPRSKVCNGCAELNGYIDRDGVHALCNLGKWTGERSIPVKKAVDRPKLCKGKTLWKKIERVLS